MEEKELLTKITLPDGWVVGEVKNNGKEIALKKVDEPKKKPKRFIDDKDALISGFFISHDAKILPAEGIDNSEANHDLFATEKQAKSALAMARISQIMANDERFGGVVTDEEWVDDTIFKYAIIRQNNNIDTETFWSFYQFLAFHTREQRDLFLQENERLVKDFLMVD